MHFVGHVMTFVAEESNIIEIFCQWVQHYWYIITFLNVIGVKLSRVRNRVRLQAASQHNATFW